MTKKVKKSGRDYSKKVTIDRALVSRLVWAYRRDIEESINYVKSIKNLANIREKSPVLTSIALHPLYESLYTLEPLVECYLAGNDGKTSDTGFTIGDGQLYELLREIHEFVKKFPPKLTVFYKNYSDYDKRRLAKSPICEICKERGANHYFSNVIVHNQCLSKVESKYCECCGILYLHNEQKCTNKPKCSNYQLKTTKTGSCTPYGSISMQITKEQFDKAKKEAGEKNTLYKED